MIVLLLVLAFIAALALVVVASVRLVRKFIRLTREIDGLGKDFAHAKHPAR